MCALYKCVSLLGPHHPPFKTVNLKARTRLNFSFLDLAFDIIIISRWSITKRLRLSLLYLLLLMLYQ